MNPLHYRRVMGRYPTGVVIVTAIDGEAGPIAMSVGSFTSVSLDPPLIAFFVSTASSTWPAIRRAGRFCVNVVGAHQANLGHVFASKGTDRFRDILWTRSPATGSPLLPDICAWIDCELERELDVGDHSMAVGLVVAMETVYDGDPLVFLGGAFGSFQPLG